MYMYVPYYMHFVLFCFVNVVYPKVNLMTFNNRVQLPLLPCEQWKLEESKSILILNMWYDLKHQQTLIVFILRDSEFWPNSVTVIIHFISLLCICNFTYFEIVLKFSSFLTCSVFYKFKLSPSKPECSLDSSLTALEGG